MRGTGANGTMRHANLSIFVAHAGCPRHCSFCNQNIISQTQSLPTTDDVRLKIEQAIEHMSGRGMSGEIAFFGGSFTAIDKTYMTKLLDCAAEYIGDVFCGIRISTRPDAIDEDILDILKTKHVTAIELGMQSMDDNVLKLNRRGHNAQDIIRASKLILKHDFSLGAQMMTGLYGDSDAGAIKTAESIIKLKPNTVRIYPTAVLRGTMLEALYNEGKYSPPNTEKSVLLCATLIDMFERADINIIRVGLHADKQLESEIVAGCYHPSFRQMCESERCYRDILNKTVGKSEIEIVVNDRYLSNILGNRKENLHRLHEIYKKVTITRDNRVEKYKINSKGACVLCT